MRTPFPPSDPETRRRASRPSTSRTKRSRSVVSDCGSALTVATGVVATGTAAGTTSEGACVASVAIVAVAGCAASVGTGIEAFGVAVCDPEL